MLCQVLDDFLAFVLTKQLVRNAQLRRQLGDGQQYKLQSNPLDYLCGDSGQASECEIWAMAVDVSVARVSSSLYLKR
jgi:hypothetical protein